MNENKKHLGEIPMKLQAILFGGGNLSRLSFTLEGFCRFHPDIPVLVVNTSQNDLSGIISRFKNVSLIYSGNIWHKKYCCGSFDPRYFGLLAGYGCNPEYTHTIYLEDDVQTLRRIRGEPQYDVAGNYYYLDNIHYCLYQYLGLKEPYLQSGAGGTIFSNRFLKSLSDNMDIIYDLYARFPFNFHSDLVCTAVALKLGFTVGIWEELECNVRMFNPHYLVDDPAMRHPVKVDVIDDPSLRHSVRKTNPCIVTAYTPNIASLGDFTSAIAKTYCDKHGYTLRVHKDGFDTTRHPTWSKILFLREALREHPWAFWIDSDAIFTNHDIKIESFVQMGGDFFICRDFPHNIFNAGVLLIRSCEWSLWFLDEVWKREDLANRTFHEQEALTDLYTAGKLGQHLVWYGTRAFNSFAYTTPDLLRGEPESLYQWQKGDFVAHCPARPDRLEILKRIAKESI